jgi:hypothetical protein
MSGQMVIEVRFSGLEVGLLLNFRASPLKEGLKRVVNAKA